jgi:hypothetical protein
MSDRGVFSPAKTSWVPFRIPPVVDRQTPDEVYVLGWNHELADAHPDPTNTNPTPFLEWKQVTATGSPVLLPFYCTPTIVAGVWKIKVQFGRVNDVVPLGMSESSPFYVDATDDGLVYVAVNFSSALNGTYGSREIDDVECFMWDSTPLTSDYTRLHILIARVFAIPGDELGYRVEQVRTGNIHFREYFTLVNGEVFLDYAYTYADNPVSPNLT